MSKKILPYPFIFLIIAVIGIAIYYNLPVPDKKALSSGEVKNAEPIKVDWDGYMPAIEKAIKEQFPDGIVLDDRRVAVYKEGDLTADGIPEALVYTGSGGAYTDELTLIMLKNGQPNLASFKQEDGAVSPMTFLSGASVRHGEETDIAPDDGVIYSISWILDESGNLEECGADVYLWNADSELFEYSPTLSDGSAQTLCQSL